MYRRRVLSGEGAISLTVCFYPVRGHAAVVLGNWVCVWRLGARGSRWMLGGARCWEVRAVAFGARWPVPLSRNNYNNKLFVRERPWPVPL